jgi:hypothetical protein
MSENLDKLEGLVWLLNMKGFAASLTRREAPIMKPTGMCFAADYADLSERDFRRMLSEVGSVDELYGIANRAAVLGDPSLKRWNERQREMIIERKFELQAKESRKC